MTTDLQSASFTHLDTHPFKLLAGDKGIRTLTHGFGDHGSTIKLCSYVKPLKRGEESVVCQWLQGRELNPHRWIMSPIS